VQSPPLSLSPSCSALPAAKSWAVGLTKSRAEKAFAEYLSSRDIPVFLPVFRRRRVYGRTVHQSLIPLFPGYVFFDEKAAPRALFFESRKLAQVLVPPDPEKLRSELSNLSCTLQSDIRESIFGQAGSPVQVMRGPLKGVFGELVRYSAGSRLIVRVSFIGKAVELEIDEAFVEKVN
jgi:hypothetical protein